MGLIKQYYKWRHPEVPEEEVILRSAEKPVGEGTTYFIRFLEDTESKKGCKLHKTARFRCCKLHKNDEDLPI